MSNFPELKNIHTKWADFDVNTKGLIANFVPHKATITDWIYRYEGIQSSIWGHTNLIKALDKDSRAAYVAAKRADLKSISDNVAEFFRREIQRQLNTGIPESMAKKKAMKVAIEYKRALLKTHNKIYPDNLTFEECMNMIKIERNGPKEKKTNKKED